MGTKYRPHLEITTAIGCPIQCKHCPQDKLQAAYTGVRRLSIDDFKTICDKVPCEVDIHFSGMCEPFINSDAVDMVEYALKNHRVSIFTTLRGLNREKYDRLLKHVYRDFCVHVPDGQLNTKMKATPEYRELLKYVNANKPKCDHFWYNVHGDYHPLLIPIIYGEEVENLLFDRAGNLEWYHLKYEHTDKVICGCGPYDQNVLLPDGTVVLCCMDYQLKHKLGNLLKQDFKDLERQRHYELCRKCNRAIEAP